MSRAAIRWAGAADALPLARLWHRTWHATYARHLQPDARKLCSLESFERRVGASLFEQDTMTPAAGGSDAPRPTSLLVDGAGGDCIAFAMIRGGIELAHLYVAPEEHGSGVAASLLMHAERVLHEERSCELAYLSVAVRNLRAIRFYEKHGWVSSSRQAWMRTQPWQSVRPDELRLSDDAAAGALDEYGGLTEEEHHATTMRGQSMKKFLGYDVGALRPRAMTSYPPSPTPPRSCS